MKKASDGDALRDEYRRRDLTGGTRGKYYRAYEEGHNLVLLKPDVAKAFPSERAVNEALSSLIEVARNATNPTKRSSKT